MKKVLFLTLGNRDLQLPPSAKIERAIYDHFDTGNIDTQDNNIIKKSDKKFIEHSRLIWENYEDCFSEVTFPMVDKSIELAGDDLQEIVIITTKQSPLDPQDCHYIALFLKKVLESKNYVVNYEPITFPPIDLGELVEFFNTLYEKYSGWSIYFGNSGGTPDMRAASHMSAMFKGVEFITLKSPNRGKEQDRVSKINNFKKQEHLVLQHIVEKMLLNYDYAGILQLPLQDDEILLLAEYAQTRLLLDHDRLRLIIENISNPDLDIPEVFTPFELMVEVAQSARIKCKQNAYADYLWRLFSIGDNLLIPDMEIILGGKIIHNKKDGHAYWNSLLDKDPELKKYLESSTVNDKPLNFNEPNAFAYVKILKYSVTNNGYIKTTTLDTLDKIIGNLRDLRNGIAHNMKGISRVMIEEKISPKLLLSNTKGIEGLNHLICQHFNLSPDEIKIYDHLNALILNRLMAV